MNEREGKRGSRHAGPETCPFEWLASIEWNFVLIAVADHRTEPCNCRSV